MVLFVRIALNSHFRTVDINASVLRGSVVVCQDFRRMNRAFVEVCLEIFALSF